MNSTYSRRMKNVPRSFIREILKVTSKPEIISFAGGLPNPDTFPISSFAAASAKTFEMYGSSAVQYSTTEGHLPLRKWIADTVSGRGVSTAPDEVLITAGSQQALDLLGKLYLDPGDKVIIERPGYIGAIQSFSLFEPDLLGLPLLNDGPDIDALEEMLVREKPKMFYAVPTFQNPTGITWSARKREQVAELLARFPDVVFVEDDPYGELRFAGEKVKPVCGLRPANSFYLSSFSKIAAPGFRLGWMCGQNEDIGNAVRVKQGADLHSSTFSQMVMSEFLENNSMDDHLSHLRKVYGEQKQCMAAEIGKCFGSEVQFTDPEGGMFIWATLPAKCRAMELFELSIAKGVAFVPGAPFYVSSPEENTLRLNYSNSRKADIEQGIAILGECVAEYLRARHAVPLRETTT